MWHRRFPSRYRAVIMESALVIILNDRRGLSPPSLAATWGCTTPLNLNAQKTNLVLYKTFDCTIHMSVSLNCQSQWKTRLLWKGLTSESVKQRRIAVITSWKERRTFWNKFLTNFIHIPGAVLEYTMHIQLLYCGLKTIWQYLKRKCHTTPSSICKFQNNLFLV